MYLKAAAAAAAEEKLQKKTGAEAEAEAEAPGAEAEAVAEVPGAEAPGAKAEAGAEARTVWTGAVSIAAVKRFSEETETLPQEAAIAHKQCIYSFIKMETPLER